jgi:hypothetical protein
LFGSPAASASPAASIALAEDVAGRRTARPLRREFRRNAVQVNRRSPLDSTDTDSVPGIQSNDAAAEHFRRLRSIRRRPQLRWTLDTPLDFEQP